MGRNIQYCLDATYKANVIELNCKQRSPASLKKQCTLKEYHASVKNENVLIPLSIEAASVVVSECVEFVRCLLLGMIVFGFAFEHDQNVSKLCRYCISGLRSKMTQTCTIIKQQ